MKVEDLPEGYFTVTDYFDEDKMYLVCVVKGHDCCVYTKGWSKTKDEAEKIALKKISDFLKNESIKTVEK